MVYVASTRSLAALEMAVNLGRASLLESFVLIQCAFDDALVETVDRLTLPDHWRRYPSAPELAARGDAWIQDAPSAVLAVPSAVIEEEIISLLNPAHRDFGKISIGPPESFRFDGRLIK
jgi:RES domain-containing protein